MLKTHQIDSIQDWTQLRSMMVPIRSLVILHETIDFYILDVSKESRKKNRKPRRSWTAPFRLSSESVSAADQGESLPLDDIDADLVRKFKRAVGQRLQGQSTIFSGLDVNCKEHFTGLQMFESIETCTNASKDSCWDYRALEKGKARVKSYSLQVLESLPGVSSPLSQSAPIGSSKGPVASKSNETSPLVADDDDDDNVKLSQIVTQVQGPSSPEEDADSALDFKSHLKERKPFGKVWWEPYTLSVYQDAVSKEWISVPSLAQPPLASVSELRHLRLWLRRSWQIEFSSL